ncbi:MAG TPA: M56 family metallopeptidase [Sphingomicrobium sp.]|nr:M56 family metallopeptidase [Sphingomicrobium sp.]
MSVLIAIALKSLLIAGLTLALLALLKHRSAAERSWVAHIGLFALVIMALAPLVLPSWTVEAPALFRETAASQSATASPAPSHNAAAPAELTALPATQVEAAAGPSISGAAAAAAIYAVPAAILLFITFLALGRLIALRARADVLVDGHWLSALARAQRRMGFKHGTALLTSNDLASPISWGLMRPVILLNSRAVEATDEAEAIIAHELAHVARMDWVKLLLARIATALFWFNPLVWVLAREAHQLREEAADDAVLAADIADTDYAQLLVGVARHECPGLLLGAHGVAPSKSSLARRVARVLDGKSVRGPVARSFAAGVFAGAVLVAAPLAALTFTPATPAAQPAVAGAPDQKLAAAAARPVRPEIPTDIPSIISQGVTASVQTAVAAIKPKPVAEVQTADIEVTAPSGASVKSSNGVMVSRSPNGATVTLYPPDARGKRRMVAVAPNGATAVTHVAADHESLVPAPATPRTPRVPRPPRESAIETAIQMKAVGLTPEYAAALRAASPSLRNATTNDLIQLRAVGVTPDYAREIARAGYGHLSADELTQARAVGLTPEYIQAIRATGVRASLDDLIEMRALGVSPVELSRVRSSTPRAGERVPRPPGSSED